MGIWRSSKSFRLLPEAEALLEEYFNGLVAEWQKLSALERAKQKKPTVSDAINICILVALDKGKEEG